MVFGAAATSRDTLSVPSTHGVEERLDVALGRVERVRFGVAWQPGTRAASRSIPTPAAWSGRSRQCPRLRRAAAGSGFRRMFMR